jgi:glycine/D-amino acid oxidase-like deaminating enzyme
MPDALWWDTGDPCYYLRVEPHRDHDVVIFGGEDHKTGQQDDTEACYRRLEERLAALVPRVELTHRWSGQVIETPDGLPYIGTNADHQYAATGYAGNGLTFDDTFEEWNRETGRRELPERVRPKAKASKRTTRPRTRRRAKKRTR